MTYLKISKEYITAMSLMAMAILTYFFKYFLNVFLARHLLPGIYGDYSVALRILTISASLILFGTNISSKRFLSKYLHDGNYKYIKRYVGWNFKLIFISIVIAFVLTIMLTIGFIVLHYLGIKGIDAYHLAVYMLSIAPLTAITLLLASFLLSDNHVYLSVFFQGLARFGLLFIFFIVSVLFFNTTINNLTIIVTFLLMTLILIAVELIFIYQKMPASIMVGLKSFWQTSVNSEKKQWLLVSGRLTISSIIFLMVCYIDLIIVEIIMPQESFVDFYAAMLIIANILLLAPRTVYQLIKPKIHQLMDSSHNRKIIQKTLDRTNIFCFLINFIIAGFIIGFSKLLLSHFGRAYTTVEVPLIILTIGYLISTCSSAATSLLALSGHEKTLLYGSIGELSGAILLVSFLTYYFGLLGTVIAVDTVIIVKVIFFIFFASKKLAIRSFLFF